MSRNYQGLKRQNKGLIKAIKAERERAEKAEAEAKAAIERAKLAHLSTDELLQRVQFANIEITMEHNQPMRMEWPVIEFMRYPVRKATFELIEDPSITNSELVGELIDRLMKPTIDRKRNSQRHPNCRCKVL